LTTSRTYETGVKQLFWGNKAEWSLSLYDIERKNVYATAAGVTLNIAGKEDAKGVEIAAAIRPTAAWKLLGQLRLCRCALCGLRFHRRVVFREYATERTPGGRQCRRLLSL
jgi:hypothetical protein